MVIINGRFIGYSRTIQMNHLRTLIVSDPNIVQHSRCYYMLKIILLNKWHVSY